MPNLLRLDESLNLALTCHPNLKKFLEGIRDESRLFLDYCDPVKLAQYCKSSRGDVFRVESSWRTFAAQDNLYAKNRSVFRKDDETVVTYARGGESYHNWGIALDLVFTRTGYGEAFYDQKNYGAHQLASLYEDCGLVAYAVACGCRWNGRDVKLPDVAHFETFHLPRVNKKEKFAVSGWWDNEEEKSAAADSPLLTFGNNFLLALVGLGVAYMFLNRKKL